jgi:hypothetical protein
MISVPLPEVILVSVLMLLTGPGDLGEFFMLHLLLAFVFTPT